MQLLGPSLVAQDFEARGLTGAVTGTRHVGGTASGAPTTGTFVAGDFSVATNGHIWVCTTGGTPGTWVDAGSYGSGGGGAPANVVTTQTATYTAVNANIVLANGTFTITLPAATAGNQVTVKNTGTGTVTVAPASGTIDGAANDVMNLQYQSRTYVGDGTNWNKI